MDNGPYNPFAPTPDDPTGAPLDRAWVESLPDPTLLIDRDGTVVAANAHARRFADQTPGSPRIAVGSNFLDACYATPGLSDFRNDLERLLTADLADPQQQQGGRVTREYALSSPDSSSVRWYLLIATPTPAGSLISQREITRRKLAEEASHRLADQRLADRHYYEELLANVPAVVWEGLCRPDGTRLRMRFVSRHAERLLGHATGDWLTNDDFLLHTVTHPDDRPRLAADLAHALSPDSPAHAATITARWLTRDGAVLWTESHVTVLHDGPGGDVSLRGVTTDVTQRRHWENSLRQRNAELGALARSLKRSNDELDQYAYVTSHDLKAPLRGIANLSNWIEEDLGPAVNETAHQQFELLRGRVHRMEALIEGILAYARVGRTRVKPELVPVAKLLKDIVDLISPPPGFIIDIDPAMPTVIAERTRLQQVFMNLLANAVKHHHDPSSGRIRVTARDADKDCFEFSVTDNGPGIDPAYHHKVWQIFQTLRPRDQVEGTGVGLSLVKKIVEDQGGTVRLDSLAGRGATFSFTWQKDVRTVKPDAPPPSPAGPSPRGTRHGP